MSSFVAHCVEASVKNDKNKINTSTIVPQLRPSRGLGKDKRDAVNT